MLGGLYKDRYKCGHSRTIENTVTCGTKVLSSGVRTVKTRCKLCRKAQRLRASKLRRERRLILDFGIDLQDLAAINELQDGRCACCGVVGTDTWRDLVVDHCHTCGKLCALLCHSCNTNNFKDTIENLQRKIRYRMKHEMLCTGASAPATKAASKQAEYKASRRLRLKKARERQLKEQHERLVEIANR